MRVKMGLAAVFVVVVASGVPAMAAETCRVGDAAAAKTAGHAEAVTAAIRNEFSCEGAFRLLDACQSGTSGDTALAEIVLSKCEPRFLPKATPAVTAAYDKARTKCRGLAEKKPGASEGQLAVCLARAGRDFAGKQGVKR